MTGKLIEGTAIFITPNEFYIEHDSGDFTKLNFHDKSQASSFPIGKKIVLLVDSDGYVAATENYFSIID